MFYNIVPTLKTYNKVAIFDYDLSSHSTIILFAYKTDIIV